MDIYKQMDLPVASRLDKIVFKKVFLADAFMSKSDCKLFDNQVERVIWKHSLKPDNCNLRVYKDEVREYPEIEIIEVVLRSEKSVARLAEIILRAIPYPMMLVFHLGEQFQLWMAQERVNQNDVAKNILEETLATDWLSDADSLWKTLSWKLLAGSDLYTIYTAIYDAVSFEKAKRTLGQINVVSGAEARQLLERENIIDRQLAQLRSKLKQETQFRCKLELNMAIKRLLAEQARNIGGRKQ